MPRNSRGTTVVNHSNEGEAGEERRWWRLGGRFEGPQARIREDGDA